MRGDRPYYFTNLKAGKGVEEIVEFIVKAWGLIG
jgi:Ni2+-binding GTPase involved in maturation of urease and hydrogenase